MFRSTVLALSFVLAVATTGAWSAPVAHAADTLEGEILDLACYIPEGAKGPAHKRCAQTCAEHGMPLGLLVEDGTVYLLFPKHGKEEQFDDVKKLAGTDAKLTGKASERAGMKGFEVHAAEAAE